MNIYSFYTDETGNSAVNHVDNDGDDHANVIALKIILLNIITSAMTMLTIMLKTIAMQTSKGQ